MYSPKFNQVEDRAILIEAMQASSFAILFGPQSTPESPAPLVATLPPLFVNYDGPPALLVVIFPKPNPQGRPFAAHETLVVFPGPHSYVSPTLYTEPLSVPTWNYIAVHTYGTLEIVDDEAGKNALLSGLIAANEPAFADQWHASPAGFRRTMLAGITGFRIPIARIEGKFKISQNRAPQERLNVQAAHAAGSPDQQALAAWMQRLISS